MLIRAPVELLWALETSAITDDNPVLSPLVRFAMVVVIVLVGGASVPVEPAILGPRWAWPLAPFTARFWALSTSPRRLRSY